jgi:peptide/nickel transport system permease protein
VRRYIARRLLQSLLVLVGVSTVVFFLLSLSGDPAALMLPPGATQEDLDRLRQSMGLDRPLPERYAAFMLDALRGDFGESIAVGTPAREIVLSRMPATIELATAALLFALVVAFPAGILAALRRNSWVDTLSMSVALLGQSVPVFWLGLMLILLFSVNLRWLPTGGRGGLDNLILPMITLGLFSMARTARLVRSGMIEVMGQDFIRTARAKGLREGAIVRRHALRSMLIPIITVIGLDLATLLGGAVITETIFSWPGIGRLVVDSIRSRDYPVVQAAVFVVATLYVVINLLVDIAYAYLSPTVRIR